MAFAAVVLAGAAAPAAPPSVVKMELVARLEGPENDPMAQPSDVVVTSAGVVWVLDGVRMRLARFAADGRFEAYVKLKARVADESRFPVALGLDGAGRLLVGDREAGAILRLTADGGADSTITIPRDPAEKPADPTDVIVSPGGATLLVVDNDNHCVKELDAQGRLVRRMGRRGSGQGELDFPATIAAAGNEYLVADVLNARVDVFDRQGKPMRTLGSRGVIAGKFYRPKGVCVDREGRVHVTDSFMGVVQTFGLDGRLFGVWGAGPGQPYRLRSPASICADGRGRVFVVEMLDNSVSVWRERK